MLFNSSPVNYEFLNDFIFIHKKVLFVLKFQYFKRNEERTSMFELIRTVTSKINSEFYKTIKDSIRYPVTYLLMSFRNSSRANHTNKHTTCCSVNVFFNLVTSLYRCTQRNQFASMGIILLFNRVEKSLP